MSLITIFSGIVVVLLPSYLLYRIALDISFGKETLFKYFDKPSSRTGGLLTVSSFVFIIGLWTFLSSSGVVSAHYLSSPQATLKALLFFFTSGDIYTNIAVSLYRIAIGFGLASILGVLLGSLAGTFSKFNFIIIPANSSFRYIPPTAFISLTIIWFGIEEPGKIALIFVAVVFYITQMIADTVRLTPRTFIEAAKMLGANRFEIFKRVVLSYSFPEILAVLRINLGAAWTFLIVSELVAAQKGLGYLLATNQRFLRTPNVFALMLIIGMLGFISDFILATVIRKVGKWQQ